VTQQRQQRRQRQLRQTGRESLPRASKHQAFALAPVASRVSSGAGSANSAAAASRLHVHSGERRRLQLRAELGDEWKPPADIPGDAGDWEEPRRGGVSGDAGDAVLLVGGGNGEGAGARAGATMTTLFPPAATVAATVAPLPPAPGPAPRGRAARLPMAAVCVALVADGLEAGVREK